MGSSLQGWAPDGNHGKHDNQAGQQLAAMVAVERRLSEAVTLLRRLVELQEQGRLEPEAEPKQRRHRAGRGEGGVKVNDPRVMARSFVRVQLLKGPKPWAEIVEAGKAKGHSPRTMRDERKKVAVVERVNGRYLWRLIEEPGMERGNDRGT